MSKLSLGYVTFYTANYGVIVRPVIYLDSQVYLVNSTAENVGSISNPYLIAQ